MHYKLGKYLRNRYKNLLSDTYDENDIYIRASDVDRTMMSAMSNLAGLYPPKRDQIWNPQVQRPGFFKHIILYPVQVITNVVKYGGLVWIN